MEIKPVVLVLADISGYTRFIRMHRVSVIHAEMIVTDLLESVIASTGLPLVVHELEGDAVAFYAVDDGPKSCADVVFEHVERFMDAFRQREAELVSECSVCACEACDNVGKLRIKVVLHRGEAVFGALRQFTKIAGEDVILAHRLLKNTVPSHEYILMTEQFLNACPAAANRDLERRIERVEGLGDVAIRFIDLQRDDSAPAPRRFRDKLRRFIALDALTIRRLLSPERRQLGLKEEW